LFFVVKWDNNGILEHGVLIIPSGAAQNGNLGQTFLLSDDRHVARTIRKSRA
jgi:hypothetical protein